MINKLSIGLTIALAIAVIVLFVQVNKLKNGGVAPATSELPANSAFASAEGPKAPILAYINGDTLNAKYQFILDRTKSLEAKYRASDEKVRKEYQKRQAEVQDLMQYAQSKQLPDDEAATIESRLQQLQVEMEQIQTKESNSVMEKEAEMQKELQGRVQKYLDAYAKQKGIDFVVNYQPTTQFILYGNGAYDVTNDVLKGLNEEYLKEKGEQK
jgi:outer membrane protein